jgi:hypothetical protein
MFIIISALGGIATAVVIKYADNILKSFAVAFGIMVNLNIGWRFI